MCQSLHPSNVAAAIVEKSMTTPVEGSVEKDDGWIVSVVHDEETNVSQTELEAAKSEIQKWHSSFQYESFIPSGTSPAKLVANYLQTLKYSEESLQEQLEKAKKKEAALIVTFAKREQEIAELKSAVWDLRAQLKPPSMQECQH
ncbi:hypothetical protein F0562_033356 [Nyssa sinensis]|uniref:Uncharacterized protein n=1 Tax=Nyssa sinensis TaxID=561372 RepID=A0A5J5AVR5_9ASTE|nr:hypothetical protein F0562_033356 [Nyssa sinensis]